MTLGGQLSSSVLMSEQNKIRENIVKTKLVCKGQLFHLPITSIQRPPIDPLTGRRPLEIREPQVVHVQKRLGNRGFSRRYETFTLEVITGY